MVHLALFLQKVTATLARIEAVKTSKALADGQVAKLGIAASGAVLKMTSTPPSSPVTAAKTQRKGGRKVFRPEGQSLIEEDASTGADGLELAPDAAGTLATVAQQDRLEAEFLLRKEANGNMPVPPPLSITQIPNQMPNSPNEQPPSPPPSPTGGSPRSMLYSPHSPGELPSNSPQTNFLLMSPPALDTSHRLSQWTQHGERRRAVQHADGGLSGLAAGRAPVPGG